MDEDTGALGAATDATPTERPGGIGALSTLAYGMGSKSPLSMAPDLLDRALPPERARQNEESAFWGGLTDPEGNKGQDIGLGVGAGLRAQTKQRVEQDKLRAAYMPLIMQSIVQSQQMTISAAQATRQMEQEAYKNLGPWMAGLRANGATPTRAQALQHLIKFSGVYPMGPGQLTSMAASLPEKPEDMKQFLDSMILSQKPDAALPAAGTNAAGQNVRVNPVEGTSDVLAPGGARGGAGAGAGAAGPGGNPSKVDVMAGEKGIEAYPKAAETLGTETQTLHDVVSRMTEVRSLQQQVQAGKYAPALSGVGAIVKDLSTRLGLPEDKALELANKIVGASPGSPNALAAAQAIGQFGLMESMAQLRDSVGNNRMNRNEFLAFQTKVNALQQDPEVFNKMYDFTRQRYGNYTNRYHDLSEASKADGMTRAPWHNDAKYHVGEAQRMLGDNGSNAVGTGPVQEPTPVSALGAAGRAPAGGSQATGQPGASGTQTAAGNGPANKAPAPLKDPRELALFEKGAILSPRGVAIIADPRAKNGFRYAKKVQ